ncbi:nuclear transport factor 2 family protein [Thaumasiovibrio subtropicus]|uniref:nuclear transport factor 2 family protein n=1 Tax=Thaumasiovibrio subtropicus TaxID=1891207 RepID=UPI000B34FDBA|nr:nuclear transport factor 2 family protein [Thaumasiovibrio subtropicus]
MILDAASPIAHFVDLYQRLDKDNIHLLKEVYDPDVVFVDPAHRIEGLAALEDYFESLYANLNYCEFDVHHFQEAAGKGYLHWTMRFSHPRLEKGEARSLEGCTMLTFAGDKVVKHQDFFDLGAMLYEAVPVVGSIIRHIKARLGQ